MSCTCGGPKNFNYKASAGDFSNWEFVSVNCRECGQHKLECRCAKCAEAEEKDFIVRPFLQELKADLAARAAHTPPRHVEHVEQLIQKMSGTNPPKCKACGDEELSGRCAQTLGTCLDCRHKAGYGIHGVCGNFALNLNTARCLFCELENEAAIHVAPHTVEKSEGYNGQPVMVFELEEDAFDFDAYNGLKVGKGA